MHTDYFIGYVVLNNTVNEFIPPLTNSREHLVDIQRCWLKKGFSFDEVERKQLLTRHIEGLILQDTDTDVVEIYRPNIYPSMHFVQNFQT